MYLFPHTVVIVSIFPGKNLPEKFLYGGKYTL